MPPLFGLEKQTDASRLTLVEGTHADALTAARTRRRLVNKVGGPENLGLCPIPFVGNNRVV